MSGSNQITASYTVPIVPTSYVSNVNGSSGAISLNVNASLSSTAAGSAITFGLASDITTALQSANTNYLTTQSVQTQASGNIARTGFSSTTTTGTAIVGTLDTNGLNLGVPAYLTTAAGAANFVLTGATSGNTTASGSTINLSGVNVTLSGTNNSQIVISAPATSGLTQGNNITITTNGSTIGISAQAVAIGASTQTATSGTVNFANSNGITFGMSGSNQITASFSQSVQTQASGNIAGAGFTSTTTTGTAIVGTQNSLGLSLGVPAYLTAAVGGGGIAAIGASTQTATSGTVIFSNANGITFGLNNGTLTASAAAAPTAYVSSINGSSGAISLNVGSSLSASTNGSSITFGLANNITTALQSANANYLTSQSVQTQASGNIARTGFSSTTTTGTAIVGTLNTDGLNLGIPAYVTNAVGGGGVAIGASTQTATSGTVNFVNSNGISFGMSGSNQITASYTTIVDYVQSFNGGTGNVSLTVGNGLSLSNNPGFPEYTINLATNITTSLQNFSLGVSNLGNTAGNTGVTGTRVVLVGANNISLSQSTNTNGATITIDQAGGVIYANLSGNVAGNTTASGNTLNFSGINVTLSGTNNSQIAISAPATSSLVGSNGISISSNGSTISVFNQFISSYENTPFQAVTTMSLNMASVSQAAIFNVPEPLSISYLRIPISVSMNSTTIATSAASATGGAAIYSTFNAVVYSIGTGGNSLSLQSVASGSGGFTFSNSISIATNGTQYSVSQGYSAQALGGGTTLTTQTSASTTNYAFSTNSFSLFSAARFLDIPFTASLNGGPYWIVFGGSTSSAATTGVAALSAVTNCNARYTNHYGVSQTNLAFGVMGSSNLTSGGYFGAGSFSTVGGGTTNSINLSQISTTAAHNRLYFQMLRFA
jgi:hypothetical protein